MAPSATTPAEPRICEDCHGEIGDTDVFVTVISLIGEGIATLHPACERARCSYCGGRGWSRMTYKATEGPECSHCGGSGREARR